MVKNTEKNEALDSENIIKPRGGFELLKWAIFEPVILKRYSATLNKKEAIRDFLKAYIWIALMTVLLWGAVNSFIALLDLPLLFPDQFKEGIVSDWQNHSTWFSKFIFISEYTAGWLLIGVVGALALGLIGGLSGALDLGIGVGSAGGLVVGLTIGLIVPSRGALALGSVGALALGLAGGLALGLAFGLVMELVFGIAMALSFGLTLGLTVGLPVGFSDGLSSGSALGLATGGGMIIGFFLFYFRIIPFFPIHLIKSIFCKKFSNNPYRKNGLIWLPIPGLKSGLIKQAYKEPANAFEFINFLMEYRPLQKTLAMHLTHAATAGLWKHNEFHSDIFKYAPIISEDRPKFKPSDEW
ncbi:MAG: hypothetical protein GY757_17450, partial [bacterium]|nr:hypothetical protein [bacterium]